LDFLRHRIKEFRLSATSSLIIMKAFSLKCMGEYPIRFAAMTLWTMKNIIASRVV
jgi:hypothetical protein